MPCTWLLPPADATLRARRFPNEPVGHRMLLVVVAPVAVTVRFAGSILHAGGFFVHQERIHAGEQVLPTETVGGNEDDVASLVLLEKIALA